MREVHADATLSLALGLALSVAGLSAEVGLADGRADSLKVELILQRKSFFLGEEIEIEVAATNRGKTEARVALSRLTSSERGFHVEVARKDGKPTEYRGPEIEDFGEDWAMVPPGKTARRKLNLTRFFGLDDLADYRVRAFATVGAARVYTAWHKFRVVPAKEAFRRDIKIARRPPAAPEQETVSLIVYALRKFQVAYFRRVDQQNKQKTGTFRRLIEVDPAHKPQVIKGRHGVVHVLLKERAMTVEEVEARFANHPLSRKRHLENVLYRWYRTRPSDGRLMQAARAAVGVAEKVVLKLVKRKNGNVQLREFGPDGQDLGVYSPNRDKKLRARSRPAPTTRPASGRDVPGPLRGRRKKVVP